MGIEPGWSKCTVTQVDEGSDRDVLDPLADVTWISCDSEWTGTKMAAGTPIPATTSNTAIKGHQRRRLGLRPPLGPATVDMPLFSR